MWIYRKTFYLNFLGKFNFTIIIFNTFSVFKLPLLKNIYDKWRPSFKWYVHYLIRTDSGPSTFYLLHISILLFICFLNDAGSTYSVILDRSGFRIKLLKKNIKHTQVLIIYTKNDLTYVNLIFISSKSRIIILPSCEIYSASYIQ